MTISAEIPEKISYVYYPEARTREGFMMLPAFPVDPKNKGRMETAKRWAEQHYRTHVYQDGKHIPNPEPKKDIVIEEYNNDPIVGVRIVDLEVRGNGGRAYKIALPNKLFVDMREDVLMEVVMKRGISPGGILNGEFIWCRVSSETKLVLVGSELHKQCIEAMKFRTKDLLKKEHEIGQMYQANNGYIIYCGKVYAKTLKGNVVARDVWIETSPHGKTNPIKTAIKAFANALETKELKESYDYYSDRSSVYGNIGKMPKVLAVDTSSTENPPDFSGVACLVEKIIENERAKAAKELIRQVNGYFQWKHYSPAAAKAAASKSGYSWYYHNYDRNPHEYYNRKSLMSHIEKSLDCLTAGIDKTSCDPVNEDLKGLFGNVETWEPVASHYPEPAKATSTY